jgi:tRNA (guanine26-N2/guanine27-N2)-dimethyltransferase
VKIQLIREGSTDVFVPVHDPATSFPPSSALVFYNPRMELSRDINVACMMAFTADISEARNYTYLDAMAASGIRGIRVANEANLSVTLNDVNPLAYKLIKRNVRHLNVRAEVTNVDANVVMSQKKFSIIDVDPFGTPAPFIDAACRSACKMLCITATDTAPLSGAHFSAGVRRYAAVPANTEYHAENGIRILVGAIVRALVKYDKYAIPLLSHATAHYYRVYVKVGRSSKSADECINELGFLAFCPNCRHRYYEKGLSPPMKNECTLCGSSMNLTGPLWLGKLHDGTFCQAILVKLKEGNFQTKGQSEKLITLCKDELDTVSFYDYHKIAKDLKLAPMPIDNVLNELRRNGYQASRTHFSGTSIKTNANIHVLKAILSETPLNIS